MIDYWVAQGVRCFTFNIGMRNNTLNHFDISYWNIFNFFAWQQFLCLNSICSFNLEYISKRWKCVVEIIWLKANKKLKMLKRFFCTICMNSENTFDFNCAIFSAYSPILKQFLNHSHSIFKFVSNMNFR